MIGCSRRKQRKATILKVGRSVSRKKDKREERKKGCGILAPSHGRRDQPDAIIFLGCCVPGTRHFHNIEILLIISSSYFVNFCYIIRAFCYPVSRVVFLDTGASIHSSRALWILQGYLSITVQPFVLQGEYYYSSSS